MILCGANVLMPNITPAQFKKSYLLYPGKICIEETGRQSIEYLGKILPEIDRTLRYDRADALRLVVNNSVRHLSKGGGNG